MKFTNFISNTLNEASGYSEILKDFDKVINAQSFANQVTVEGIINGKKETKRYVFYSARTAHQVSMQVNRYKDD